MLKYVYDVLKKFEFFYWIVYNRRRKEPSGPLWWIILRSDEFCFSVSRVDTEDDAGKGKEL